MSMNLAEKTWPYVNDYLKRSQKIIVPVGSTEQHGPTGLLGIDFLTSKAIAEKVGLQQNILVAPPLPFGMAVHHMEFPGTLTLTPTTYVRVICELIQSFTHHGFNKIYFVNGHGGNIAPLTTAFCETKQKDEEFSLSLYNWWQLPEVQEYESTHFGDENGFHATVGEISVSQFLLPQAYTQSVPPRYFKTLTKTSWPLSPKEFRKQFPDGRMGSNPQLSNAEHGRALFDIAVAAIEERIQIK